MARESFTAISTPSRNLAEPPTKTRRSALGVRHDNTPPLPSSSTMGAAKAGPSSSGRGLAHAKPTPLLKSSQNKLQSRAPRPSTPMCAPQGSPTTSRALHSSSSRADKTFGLGYAGDETALLDVSMSGLVGGAEYETTDDEGAQADVTWRGKGVLGPGRLMTPSDSQEANKSLARKRSSHSSAQPTVNRLPTPPPSQSMPPPTPPIRKGRPRPIDTPPRASFSADIVVPLREEASPNPRVRKTPRLSETRKATPAKPRVSPSFSVYSAPKTVVRAPLPPPPEPATVKASSSRSRLSAERTLAGPSRPAPVTAPVHRLKPAKTPAFGKRAGSAGLSQTPALKTLSARTRRSLTPMARDALRHVTVGYRETEVDISDGDDPILLHGMPSPPRRALSVQALHTAGKGKGRAASHDDADHFGSRAAAAGGALERDDLEVPTMNMYDDGFASDSGDDDVGNDTFVNVPHRRAAPADGRLHRNSTPDGPGVGPSVTTDMNRPSVDDRLSNLSRFISTPSAAEPEPAVDESDEGDEGDVTMDNILFNAPSPERKGATSDGVADRLDDDEESVRPASPVDDELAATVEQAHDPDQAESGPAPAEHLEMLASPLLRPTGVSSALEVHDEKETSAVPSAMESPAAAAPLLDLRSLDGASDDGSDGGRESELVAEHVTRNAVSPVQETAPLLPEASLVEEVQDLVGAHVDQDMEHDEADEEAADTVVDGLTELDTTVENIAFNAASPEPIADERRVELEGLEAEVPEPAEIVEFEHDATDAVEVDPVECRAPPEAGDEPADPPQHAVQHHEDEDQLDKTAPGDTTVESNLFNDAASLSDMDIESDSEDDSAADATIREPASLQVEQAIGSHSPEPERHAAKSVQVATRDTVPPTATDHDSPDEPPVSPAFVRGPASGIVHRDEPAHSQPPLDHAQAAAISTAHAPPVTDDLLAATGHDSQAMIVDDLHSMTGGPVDAPPCAHIDTALMPQAVADDLDAEFALEEADAAMENPVFNESSSEPAAATEDAVTHRASPPAAVNDAENGDAAGHVSFRVSPLLSAALHNTTLILTAELPAPVAVALPNSLPLPPTAPQAALLEIAEHSSGALDVDEDGESAIDDVCSEADITADAIEGAWDLSGDSAVAAKNDEARDEPAAAVIAVADITARTEHDNVAIATSPFAAASQAGNTGPAAQSHVTEHGEMQDADDAAESALGDSVEVDGPNEQEDDHDHYTEHDLHEDEHASDNTSNDEERGDDQHDEEPSASPAKAEPPVEEEAEDSASDDGESDDNEVPHHVIVRLIEMGVVKLEDGAVNVDSNVLREPAEHVEQLSRADGAAESGDVGGGGDGGADANSDMGHDETGHGDIGDKAPLAADEAVEPPDLTEPAGASRSTGPPRNAAPDTPSQENDPAIAASGFAFRGLATPDRISHTLPSTITLVALEVSTTPTATPPYRLRRLGGMGLLDAVHNEPVEEDVSSPSRNTRSRTKSRAPPDTVHEADRVPNHGVNGLDSADQANDAVDSRDAEEQLEARDEAIEDGDTEVDDEEADEGKVDEGNAGVPEEGAWNEGDSADGDNESVDADAESGHHSFPAAIPQVAYFRREVATPGARSLHDEMADVEDDSVGDDSFRSVVEISSLDPRAAARAAAILKLNHAYIEHGILPEHSPKPTRARTARRHTRSRSRHFDTIESSRLLSKDELLHEAELEIVETRHAATPSVRGRARSLSVLTTYTDDSYCPLPGAWAQTPLRKRKRAEAALRPAPVLYDTTSNFSYASSLARVDVRAKAAGTSTGSGRPWTVRDWKRLEGVYKAEREAWQRECDKPASLFASWRCAPAWDNGRVIDAFLAGETNAVGIECKGEWAREVIALRVEAIERRLAAQRQTIDAAADDEPVAKRLKTDTAMSTLQRAINWVWGLGRQPDSDELPLYAERMAIAEHDAAPLEHGSAMSDSEDEDGAPPPSMRQIRRHPIVPPPPLIKAAHTTISNISASALEEAMSAAASTTSGHASVTAPLATRRYQPSYPSHPSTASRVSSVARPSPLSSAPPIVAASSISSSTTSAISIPSRASSVREIVRSLESGPSGLSRSLETQKRELEKSQLEGLRRVRSVVDKMRE